MTRRIPELDGVRGIAILLIIVVHFGDYTQTNQNVSEQAVRAVMGFGWTGVDLFFVLSGCLITGILLDAKSSPTYFRSFYARRALRILPLYYAAVALFFFFALPLAHALHRGLGIHSSEQTWFWFYLANWRIGFNEYAVEPLSHFWSLAIEEQFYLVWPVVVLLVSELRLVYVCAGVIAGALVLRSLPPMLALHAQYPELLYSLTPFRIDALAFGALVTLVARRETWRQRAQLWLPAAFVAGIAAIASVMIAARSVRPFSTPMGRFGFSAVDLTCACIVYYALTKTASPDPITRLLRTAPLRSLGKYSYAIYVIHWPISLYLTDLFQARFQRVGALPAAFLCIAAGLIISYFLALISWNLFEKHFLQLQKRFPYSVTSQPRAA